MRKFFVFLLIGSMLFVGNVPAFAADGTWNVNVSGNWSNADNWVGDPAGGAGFTATFLTDLTADRVVTLDSDRTIGSLIFGDTTPSGHNWTIKDHKLTLDNLGSTPTITVNDLSHPDPLEYDGDALISSVLAGSQGFTKAGIGELVIAGNNEYTGTTTVSAGLLTLVNGSAISDTGAVVIASGAELAVIDSEAVGSVSGVAGSTIYLHDGSILTVGGDNSNTEFAGVIEDNEAGKLVKTGTGTLTLSGNNTYTGTTTISNGTVQASNIVVSGDASNLGNAASAVVLGDATNEGILHYTGADATYTRGFTVNAGGGGIEVDNALTTLTIASGGISIAETGTFFVGGAGHTTISSIISGYGELEKEDAGTLILSAENTYAGATTIDEGTVHISADSGLGTAPGSATVGHLTIRAGLLNATESFTLNANRGIELTGAATIGANDAKTLTYNGIIAGTGSLTKANTGTLVLGGANTYDGVTQLAAGTLTLEGDNIGATGGVTMSADTTLNLGHENALGTGTLTINGGTIKNSSAEDTLTLATNNDQTWGGNFIAGDTQSLNLGTGTVTLTDDINVTLDVNILTVGGAIEGGKGLTIGDSNGTTSWGRLVLAGDNTYTGLTTLNKGTLDLTGDNSGASGGITVNSSGTLRIGSATALGTGRLTVNQGQISMAEHIESDMIITTDNPHTWQTSFKYVGPYDLHIGNGDVTLDNDVEVWTGEKNLTVGGNIVSGGGTDRRITKPSGRGVGTLTLLGNVAASGLSVEEGRLDTTGTINLSNSSSVASGAVFNLSSGSMTGTGAPTMTIAGTGYDATYTLDVTDPSDVKFTLDIVDSLTNPILNVAEDRSFIISADATTPGLKSSGSIAGMGVFSLNGGLFMSDGTAFGATELKIEGSGLGLLKISGVETFTPAQTTVNNGTLAIVSDGGTMTFGDTTVTNGDIFAMNTDSTAGFGNLTVKDSSSVNVDATMTVTGDLLISPDTPANGAEVNVNSNLSVTGTSTVNDGGILRVNGDLTSTGGLSVASGGTLKGAGTLIGAVTGESGGTVAPGNSVGTLNVTGAFTLASGSTLEVTAESDTHYSKVIATGSVTVDAASIVDVTVDGYISNNAILSVVEGDGSGTINAPTTVNSNNTKVSFTASDSGDGRLFLTASRAASGFASNATDGNASALGSVLDNVTDPTSDMQTILDTLEGLSAGDVDSALQTMEPSVDGGIVSAGNLSVGQMLQSISNHFSLARGAASGVSTGDADVQTKNTGAKDIWAKAFGTYTKQDKRKGIEGYRADVMGGALGVDFVANEKATFGISTGYAYNKIKPKKASLGNTEADSIQGSLYYSYNNEVDYLGAKAVYFDLIGSFAYSMYEGKRNVAVGGINRQAKAEYDGQQYTVYGEAGYHIPAGDIDLIPLASLQYTRSHFKGYTEKGADSMNLKVNKQNYDLLEMGLGLKIASIIRNEDFDIIPSVRGKWLYDFIADKAETTSRFTGGGASFKTQGAKPPKSSFDIGTTLTFLGKNNVQIDLDYDLNVKNKYQSHSGAVTFKYRF
jgi:fibronectin-binding autotransporter adhesin